MTDEEFDKRYPLHGKLADHLLERRAINDFLNWANERGWYLCHGSETRGMYRVEDGFHSITCQFLGIDPKELRKEKDQIYQDFLKARNELKT